jgi:hypothetical protein
LHFVAANQATARAVGLNDVLIWWGPDRSIRYDVSFSRWLRHRFILAAACVLLVAACAVALYLATNGAALVLVYLFPLGLSPLSMLQAERHRARRALEDVIDDAVAQSTPVATRGPETRRGTADDIYPRSQEKAGDSLIPEHGRDGQGTRSGR